MTSLELQKLMDAVRAGTVDSAAAAEQIAATGRYLQARLGEISQLLGISFPVYVLFTLLSPTTRVHLQVLSRLSFVLRDPATMGRLAKALDAPINVNVRAGSPSVAELEALGVKRASTATAIPLMAMGLVRQLAEQLRATHRFDALNPAMTHPEAQQLLAPRE